MIKYLYKKIGRKINNIKISKIKDINDEDAYKLWIKNNEYKYCKKINSSIKFLIKILDSDFIEKEDYISKSINNQGNFNYTFNENEEFDYVIITHKYCLLNKNCIYNILKVLKKRHFDAIYGDSDYISINKDGDFKRYNPIFKPDYSDYTIKSGNYIGNLIVVKKDIYNKIQIRDKDIYEIILNITKFTEDIKHIPKILYHDIYENKDIEKQKLALKNFFDSINEDVKVEAKENTLKSVYTLKYNPLVSIIIPNKDSLDMLKVCLNSIEKSTYSNYEIIIVENNSKTDEIFDFYDKIKSDKIRIEKLEINGFNFSKIVNYGVSKAKGEYVILLNNDVEIIEKNWIENFLMYAMKEDVGAVGAKLFFKDNTIQHAGVVLGIRGLAGHIHRLESLKNGYSMYANDINILRNVSVVTAACIMINKELYETVGGFDERLAVDFNDVDFCLKLQKLGKKNIYNPYVEAYHYESQTRNLNSINIKRFNREFKLFRKIWANYLFLGDKYYNINLRLDTDKVCINFGKVYY